MRSSNTSAQLVYQKSLALKDLSNAIANYFSYDGNFFSYNQKLGLRNDIAYALLTDASLIAVTVEQAAKSSSKTLRNKNLTFVNVMTRNILSYCNGLEKDGVKEKEYINLLRREIKVFRKSFKQWRKSLTMSDD